jgi:hypothetical protein
MGLAEIHLVERLGEAANGRLGAAGLPNPGNALAQRDFE